MQIPGVHIETLHNPVRYTYAQIEKACAIAQMLNRGSWCSSSRLGAEPPSGEAIRAGEARRAATLAAAAPTLRSRASAPGAGVRRLAGRAASTRATAQPGRAAAAATTA